MGKKLENTIGNIAEGAAGGVIGTGLGLLLEGHNDRRQQRQQKALTEIQSNANKQLASHNYDLQMKMWEETNYKAQMEQLEKAGLNPGLIYGMSGGGGATTNAAQAGAVSGGTAQGNSGEAMGMMMNRMQLEMMQAQKENIQADTENKQADTLNKPKVGAQIDQSISSAKSQQAVTDIEAQVKALQQLQLEATFDKQMETIINSADIIAENLKIIQNDADISAETKEAQIIKARTEAANEILKGQAIKQGIKVDEATIQKIAADIAQGWSRIGIEQFKAEIEANFKGLDKIAGNLIEMMFQKIDDTLGIKQDRTPNKIK